MKYVIKSGGEWISSVDMENAITANPAVLEATVVGVTHPKWEERPILLEVPRQGCQPTRESVLAHIGEHFAKWQAAGRGDPGRVALPMTATGKISKKDLREKFKDTLVQKEQAAG